MGGRNAAFFSLLKTGKKSGAAGGSSAEKIRHPQRCRGIHPLTVCRRRNGSSGGTNGHFSARKRLDLPAALEMTGGGKRGGTNGHFKARKCLDLSTAPEMTCFLPRAIQRPLLRPEAPGSLGCAGDDSGFETAFFTISNRRFPEIRRILTGHIFPATAGYSPYRQIPQRRTGYDPSRSLKNTPSLLPAPSAL